MIADADNGYGNAINVIRTVREYIQTGVAAIHIEDQVIPKRCGHVAGRRVIPLEEAVGKYRAADQARRRARPGLRPHRAHRRARRPRRQPRRGHPPRQRLPRRGRRPRLRRGADQRRRGAAHLPRGQGAASSTTRPACPRASRVAEMQDLGIAVTILPGALLRVTVQAAPRLRARPPREGPGRGGGVRRALPWPSPGRPPHVRRVRPGPAVGGGVPAARGAREVRGLGRPRAGRPARRAVTGSWTRPSRWSGRS